MTSTWAKTVAPVAPHPNDAKPRMPHVAMHGNRNTFQDWAKITAAHWGIETILS